MQPATYEWTCSACGMSNPRSTVACSECGCPFQATVAEIEACRALHVAAGNTVLPGAADLGDPDEVRTVAKALWALLYLLSFGLLAVPFGRRAPNPRPPESR